jgi:hypothetical protein
VHGAAHLLRAAAFPQGVATRHGPYIASPRRLIGHSHRGTVTRFVELTEAAPKTTIECPAMPIPTYAASRSSPGSSCVSPTAAATKPRLWSSAKVSTAAAPQMTTPTSKMRSRPATKPTRAARPAGRHNAGGQECGATRPLRLGYPRRNLAPRVAIEPSLAPLASLLQATRQVEFAAVGVEDLVEQVAYQLELALGVTIEPLEMSGMAGSAKTRGGLRDTRTRHKDRSVAGHRDRREDSRGASPAGRAATGPALQESAAALIAALVDAS